MNHKLKEKEFEYRCENCGSEMNANTEAKTVYEDDLEWIRESIFHLYQYR
ncbi:hypothetical protein [Thermoflavimicrobium dichotomicum]|uniref:Uncharacterized protein n=1 Tax=Thermoflavimicrobium dichotomicum TaxID=46223 RepID=A0A1I3R5S1_9BACL|nr:hypothetical protein [Thermoflavimicrobium dichotomicum]SFJ40781.1 hypothetical protein SAMN05421852_1091 [Thermoflavimicrobium dichotomicum]